MSPTPSMDCTGPKQQIGGRCAFLCQLGEAGCRSGAVVPGKGPVAESQSHSLYKCRRHQCHGPPGVTPSVRPGTSATAILRPWGPGRTEQCSVYTAPERTAFIRLVYTHWGSSSENPSSLDLFGLDPGPCSLWFPPSHL